MATNAEERHSTMKKHINILTGLALLATAGAAHATVIGFDGGEATLRDGSKLTTDNIHTYYDVDYYKEGGFTADFIGNTESSAAIIGNYEGAGNAIIHGHWDSGDYGDLTGIKFTKDDGATFDLNYFIITSNTQIGGGWATGQEEVYITHDGNQDPIKLPSVNWGTFPGSQVLLPDSYDAISSFEFHAANKVDCFGMDMFYINEPPPPGVPDGGSSLALLGLGLATLAGLRKRVS